VRVSIRCHGGWGAVEYVDLDWTGLHPSRSTMTYSLSLDALLALLILDA